LRAVPEALCWPLRETGAGQLVSLMQAPDSPERTNSPVDADARRAANPVICYAVDALPRLDKPWLARWRESLEVIDTVIVPPRDAMAFAVPVGHGFRIVSVDGPQVGDLNLFNADNPEERFWSGKTRQLHASHLTTGHRLWSNLPYLRPLATITSDSLDWYGVDADGGRVHDVIGTRCDPYTNHLLKGVDYHHCCHSNLTRALADATGWPLSRAGSCVHDVMNVFMCTGFTQDTGQYFMKASPVRPGDAIEFLAEVNLLGVLSACPGGDCGAGHSDEAAPCHPLHVEILRPAADVLDAHEMPAKSDYSGSHGRP